MWRGLLAAALLLGCRGEPAPRAHEPPRAATPVRSVVPPLPRSPDGAQELVALDLEIERARAASDPEAVITALSRRAMLRGRHDDLREALDRSQRWTFDDKRDPRAWAARIAILTQAHRFGEADLRFDDWKPLAQDPSEWEPAAATLFEARGKPELARDHRERAAKLHPTAVHITDLAANLAMRGQVDDAIAMIPHAAEALHDPSPVLVAWLLVQWGRFYVLNGEAAVARQLFEEAHRRMPGYVEATLQLAAAIRATGGDPRELAITALATEPLHPELLALAGRTAEADQAWAAYLKAPLEEAFADHAARFYLDAGRDPGKAVRLAERSFGTRQTVEARALLVEAELANAMWKDACRHTGPLATGTRAQQFLAWRAFTACGQATEADRLAQALGIR